MYSTKEIKVGDKNNFEDNILFSLKEIYIIFPKSYAFLILYNILKLFLEKNPEKKKNYDIKIQIFRIIFKRLFYSITLIPFIVIKINCIIYNIYNKQKKYKSEAFLARIDDFFMNVYLKNIKIFIYNVKKHKIIKINNKVFFNPFEKLKFIFSGSKKYFEKKINFENNSEFKYLKTKHSLNGKYYKHLSKVNDLSKKNATIKILSIWNETSIKSDKKYILDKNGNKIESKLESKGTINPENDTMKIGPIITSEEQILTRLPGGFLKNLKDKNELSWLFTDEMFYNSNIIELENDHLIKNNSLTYKAFLAKNYDSFNEETQSFIDEKENFDSVNSSIINSMSSEELEKSFKSDFTLYSKINNDYFNDKYKSDFNDESLTNSLSDTDDKNPFL